MAPLQTIVASLDSKLENGDMLVHTLHRHEPPVTAKPIERVYEDDRLIVINKPAGVPVHPAGRYNFNTVIEIMKHDCDGRAPLRTSSPSASLPPLLIVLTISIFVFQKSMQPPGQTNQRPNVHG